MNTEDPKESELMKKQDYYQNVEELVGGGIHLLIEAPER